MTVFGRNKNRFSWICKFWVDVNWNPCISVQHNKNYFYSIDEIGRLKNFSEDSAQLWMLVRPLSLE